MRGLTRRCTRRRSRRSRAAVGAGERRVVNSGRIDFGNINTGKSFEVELNLHFTNRIQVHQRFHARWHPTPCHLRLML
jgi:hypothetical protein